MGRTRRRKKKTVQSEENIGGTVPRSFVFHRGVVGNTVMELLLNLRKMMEPYTARNLKVRRQNVMKDFLHVAGPMGVTHFLVLSKTETCTNLRVVRLPRGPTLSFQVEEFSLMKDIASILRRPKSIGKQFEYSPLLVMNGFKNDTLPIKLTTAMFQNLFPSISVQKVNLSEIRRCVLLNYDPETRKIDLRHYDIHAVPTGISRGLKKLVRSRIPDLGKLSDISEFMTGAGYMSESEGEEPEDSRVVLPQKVIGRGNIKAEQSAIRLTELGPRMTLKLVKIQEGLFDGEVLFHEYVSKTEQEKRELKKKQEEKRKLKAMRRRKQEEDVRRKLEAKDRHKQRSLAGMTKQKSPEEADSDEDNTGLQKDGINNSEESDADHYREEVGEEPEAELFSSSCGKKRSHSFGGHKFKAKRRKENEPRSTEHARKGAVKRQKFISNFKRKRRVLKS